MRDDIMCALWPENGETDWNTKMLEYLAVEHNEDGTHINIIENRTDDPESPVTGRMWFRTDV